MADYSRLAEAMTADPKANEIAMARRGLNPDGTPKQIASAYIDWPMWRGIGGGLLTMGVGGYNLWNILRPSPLPQPKDNWDPETMGYDPVWGLKVIK